MELRRMLALMLPWAAIAIPAVASPSELLVFATTSLSQSLGRISEQYASDTGQHVTLSYGSSSQLAHHIEGGTKADVVLCADSEWMDYLVKRNLVVPASRRDLLRTRLALVAPAGSDVKLPIGRTFALRAALGDSKLAIGNPEEVPVGRYTRYALISLGVWNTVGDHLLTLENSRAVIGAIADGAARFGVVFESDAMLDKRVRIVDMFPPDSHPTIAFAVAATPGAQPTSARFMEYLRNSGSRGVFERYGLRLTQ